MAHGRAGGVIPTAQTTILPRIRAARTRPVSIEEHYKALLGKQGELLAEMLGDAESLSSFTQSNDYGNDLEKLTASLGNRPEAIIWRLAGREYQFALTEAAVANYRHAYMALRLSMELSLGAIYFSAYEIKLRRWLSGTADILWEPIINKDEGIYSKNFITAFGPDFATDGAQYGTLVAVAYRECSEFVHGNLHTHVDPNEPMKFDKGAFMLWNERANSVRLGVLFAYAARYLAFMSAESKNSLEAIMTGDLGHLAGVQAAFAKAEEVDV
jgi:hypothetical protein